MEAKKINKKLYDNPKFHRVPFFIQKGKYFPQAKGVKKPQNKKD
jgi:hypothetical protein